MVWTYEANWSLLWAQDWVTNNELIDASKPCDTDTSTYYCEVIASHDYPYLRKIDKIKEKAYLYYCYEWAFLEKINNPNISTGNLNFEVVMERRRGFEWLIREEKDWFNLKLGTTHKIPE